MSGRVGRQQHPTDDSSHLSPWYRMCRKLHPCHLFYLSCSATVQGEMTMTTTVTTTTTTTTKLICLRFMLTLPSYLCLGPPCGLFPSRVPTTKNTCTHLKKQKDNLTKYIPLPPKITFPNNTRKIQDTQHSYIVVLL